MSGLPIKLVTVEAGPARLAVTLDSSNITISSYD